MWQRFACLAQVESTLLRTLETGQVSEMEEATAHAAQFGLDRNLVKISRVLIQRLTDAYLGFDGPGAFVPWTVSLGAETCEILVKLLIQIPWTLWHPCGGADSRRRCIRTFRFRCHM